MGDPALFTFRDNGDFEFYDNVILHRGRHTIKAGAYFMHYNLRPVNPNGARGVFSFTPRWTSSAPGLADGNAFADFLLGYPTTAQVGLGRAALDANANWAHFYVQDNWQVTRTLKVDVGVRYEYNQNMTDSDNLFAAVDPSVAGGRFVIASDSSGKTAPAGDALLPFMPIPSVSSSAAGWNNSLLTSRSLRLAPRLGFAWYLPKNTKTVIRGGFGIIRIKPHIVLLRILARIYRFRYQNSEFERHRSRADLQHRERSLCQRARNRGGEQSEPRFQNRIQRGMEPEPGT